MSAPSSHPSVAGRPGSRLLAWRFAGLALWQVGALLVAGVVLGIFLYRLEDRRSGPAIVIDDPRADATIVVQVVGAVATPGVYDLPHGARVDDVLDRAGGPLPEADLSSFNLARRLEDGEQVVVPAVQPTVTPPPPGQPTATMTAGPPTAVPTDSAAPTEPAMGLAVAEPTTAVLVNLNTATVDQLVALPEIGEARAEAIVAYREANGPFESVDELVNVDGISERIVELIRPFVTVGS